MSWPLGAVSDIAEIISGYAFKSEWFGSGFDKVIRIGDLQDGRVQLDSALCVDAKINNVSSQFKIRPKDILMALSGATVGKIAIAQERDAGAYINQRVAIIRGKTPEAAEFLKYVFSGALQEKLLLSAGGAAQPNLSTKSLALMEIPLPPLAEQKRIAAILDKADAIRRKRQQAIKLADEFLRSVFLDMFGDPVTNPKGWEVKTIEQLVKKEKHSLKRGPFGGALKKEIFKESGYLVYEQFHALNDDFTFQRYFIDEAKFTELKAFEVFAGDIIISCSGVNLGRLAIVPDGSPRGIINQALLKVTLDNKKILNEFFVNVFTNPNFKEEFFGDERGSGVPNFPPMSSFKEFKFICPPINLQHEYLKVFRVAKKMLEHLIDGLEEKNGLFNSLSQKAFSGSL